MYQIYKVLDPPESIDLTTLEDMRVFLNMRPGIVGATDEQVNLVITQTSAALAKAVNRVFGFQKVQETFFEIEGIKRLYFSKSWPVKLEDVESLTLNGVDILPNIDFSWVLEEATGTLYMPGGLWTGTVDCVYSGGYKLPAEAPPDLAKAASAVMTESYYTLQRGMLATGVRMLSHKGARVQFQQPTTQQTGGVGGGTPAWNAAMSTLDHYFRPWI